MCYYASVGNAGNSLINHPMVITHPHWLPECWKGVTAWAGKSPPTRPLVFLPPGFSGVYGSYCRQNLQVCLKRKAFFIKESRFVGCGFYEIPQVAHGRF